LWHGRNFLGQKEKVDLVCKTHKQQTLAMEKNYGGDGSKIAQSRGKTYGKKNMPLIVPLRTLFIS